MSSSTTTTTAAKQSAPPVPKPEALIKKKKSATELAKKRAQREKAKKQTLKHKRKIIFKRAERYAKEYEKKERGLINIRRKARAGGNFFVEPEARLAIVVRIRGINGVDPRTKKILQLFRLRQIHTAVFVRLNAATLKMLKLVEPYITYGTPNLKTVKELIYKRGFVKLRGQRKPITDNLIIERKLGKRGLLCIEDLIHEIYTVGPRFSLVNKFLWPFKLSSPRGGYKKKTTHFQEGGDAGNREDKINRFVRAMN